MRKIYLAGDHAGFTLKQAVAEHLRIAGYEVEDLGALTLDPTDDYPHFVTPLALRIAHEPDSLGIIFGGTGQGEAMCANRVTGVRAAVFYGQKQGEVALDVEGGYAEDGYDIVRLPRKHNNANVLSLAARFVSEHDAYEAIRIFIETPFSEGDRHVRRLAEF